MLIALSLLLFLILLNGVFALSEIAIVSSRRARLVQLADDGHAGASRALALAAEPTRFLSTVQVGITSIGIMSGAIGEAAIASPLRALFEQLPVVAPYASGLSLVVMVVALTYISLILGELVPKRLGLTRPEAIAALIAGPMHTLSAIVRPLVSLLSGSTDAILRVLRVPTEPGPAVTAEEIKVLLEQGAVEGVFDKTERELVTNVLDLDERKVAAVMTSRSDIVFLNALEPFERNRETLSRTPHSTVPVCEGTLEHLIGVVRSTDILGRLLAGEAVDLRALASPPLFVPRTASVMRLLEQFRHTHVPLAFVVDEFGDIDGLVSLSDVLSAIVGDLPQEANEEPRLVRRADGSLLVDGSLEIEVRRRTLDDDAVFVQSSDDYHTVGGFVMAVLGRVPKTGDVFERDGFRFEIMDMDGNRVDRVLVSALST